LGVLIYPKLKYIKNVPQFYYYYYYYYYSGRSQATLGVAQYALIRNNIKWNGSDIWHIDTQFRLETDRKMDTLRTKTMTENEVIIVTSGEVCVSYTKYLASTEV
jgi:hypothetical protein